MDNKNEIKRANRKAMPMFLLVVVLCGILGGTVGYLSAKYGLNTLSDRIKAAAELFGLYIAPWLMVAIAILMPVICIPLYRSAKKLLDAWNGEDEAASDAAEKKISIAIWIASACLIISFFLIAASYSGGFALFEREENTLLFFVAIGAFVGIMVETAILLQKCIDAAKKTNPEKTASVYDMKFQKKWLDSCDEAEKIMIGKCAFKAWNATNTVCTILAFVLACCALVFDIGFLPSLAVCVIWIVNLSVYSSAALKYSKAGNKIL